VSSLTFEESMKKLEEMSMQMKRNDITLQEAIKCYEEGVECYKECNKILQDAQQKIKIYGEDEEQI
jgi:exodeoxyribonuclease VII small subunit